MQVLISCSGVMMALGGKAQQNTACWGLSREAWALAIEKLSVTRSEFATSLWRWGLSNFLKCILPKFHTFMPTESGIGGAAR